MKTQLTWEECCDQVAKKYHFADSLALLRFGTLQQIEEAADIYRNQPSSLNKEELMIEYAKTVRDEVERLESENLGTDSMGGFEFEWWVSKLSAKQREVDELREALNKIAYPVKYLQAEAEKEGNQLNGIYAAQLSNDANWLKEIARQILSKLGLTDELTSPSTQE